MAQRIDCDALDTVDLSGVITGEAIPKSIPGDTLRLDFMEPMAVSSYGLAKAIEVPANRITGILHGTRAITADTAIKLARYFGTSAEMWMNLQTSYDLAVARERAMEIAPA